jgi:uncharacterized protein YkwD
MVVTLRGWRILGVVWASLLAAGCATSVTLVSPKYASRPVQPLNSQAAVAEVNAFRARHGLGPLVLDARLSQAASMQSNTQARRSWIGHRGSDGSKPRDRAVRAGYRPRIVAENVASGQKSFSDVMRNWEKSAGHRKNLLRPDVRAAGVAMAKNESGRAYWTLVLGSE